MGSQAKTFISMLVGAGLLVLGWKVPFLLNTIHVLLCFLLIVVVLLQSGKAADLAGAFGGAGSQTAFGPRGAATFLSRATAWCAVMFMLTSLALVLRQEKGGPTGSSVLEQFSKPASKQPPAPTAPPPQQQSAPATQAPQQQPAPGATAPQQPPSPQTPSPQPPAKP